MGALRIFGRGVYTAPNFYYNRLMDILLLVGVGVVTAIVSLGGGFLLLMESKLARILQKYGAGIAALVLLAAVFFDLLPEALESRSLALWQVLLYALGGWVMFGVIGMILGRLHKHGGEHHFRNRRQAIMMGVVDIIHTLADGVMLGVAFAAGPATGIWAAVAIAAHEIPQEVGDFAIMLRSKIPKKRIVHLQVSCALLIVPASVMAFLIGDGLMGGMPILLAVVAGFFLYIAYGEARVILRGWKSKKP